MNARNASFFGIVVLAAFGAIGPAACARGTPANTFVSAPPDAGGAADAGENQLCGFSCSADFRTVLDCTGKVVKECGAGTGCNAKFECVPACEGAQNERSNIGCDFFVPNYHVFPSETCLAAFIVNSWHEPIAIHVDLAGQALDVSGFARIPRGAGMNMTYDPLPDSKLPPGEIAVLFLNQYSEETAYHFTRQRNCPAGIRTAAEMTALSGTGLSTAFHISTTGPAAAYDIIPYGGGPSAITSATMLLPTATWDKAYVAIDGYKSERMTSTPDDRAPAWMLIVAADDNTHVTLTPRAPIESGPSVNGSDAGVAQTIVLQKGQVLQLEQGVELTGSSVVADKSIGVWGGQICTGVPTGTIACDSLHQQIPPIASLGHEYAAVRYRNRFDDQPEEMPPWRLVGVVDGTVLTYEPSRPAGLPELLPDDPPVPAPTTLNAGQLAEFRASGPFIVRSQDSDHPFYMAGYMTGCATVNSKIEPGGDPADCRGDPDFVNVIPTEQYLSSYVFFTDPTYPETNLVLVRKRGNKEVILDCAGPAGDWQPIGSTSYEFSRVDLVRGNFEGQHGCQNGRHEIHSDDPFALTVWGWGSMLTGGRNPDCSGCPDTPGFYSQAVSYAYPGGQSLVRINTVDVPK